MRIQRNFFLVCVVLDFFFFFLRELHVSRRTAYLSLTLCVAALELHHGHGREDAPLSDSAAPLPGGRP